MKKPDIDVEGLACRVWQDLSKRLSGYPVQRFKGGKVKDGDWLHFHVDVRTDGDGGPERLDLSLLAIADALVAKVEGLTMQFRVLEMPVGVDDGLLLTNCKGLSMRVLHVYCPPAMSDGDEPIFVNEMWVLRFDIGGVRA